MRGCEILLISAEQLRQAALDGLRQVETLGPEEVVTRVTVVRAADGTFAGLDLVVKPILSCSERALYRRGVAVTSVLALLVPLVGYARLLLRWWFVEPGVASHWVLDPEQLYDGLVHAVYRKAPEVQWAKWRSMLSLVRPVPLRLVTGAWCLWDDVRRCARQWEEQVLRPRGLAGCPRR